MKESFKNVGLWFSLAGVIYLFIEASGYSITPDKYEFIVNTLAYILVSFGVLSNPKEGKFYLNRSGE